MIALRADEGDAIQRRLAMDTTRPPLMCERCREPIRPTDHFRVLTARDEEAETGKPAVISGKVVHEKCWAAWAKANGTE